MADLPGYSASADDLASLPFDLEPPAKVNASAKLLADQYLRRAAENEPVQDARLRSGSAFTHELVTVEHQLTAAGVVEDQPGELRRLAKSIMASAGDRRTLIQRLAEDRQANAAPAPTANTLVDNLRARRGE